jgi:hypothetical protein
MEKNEKRFDDLLREKLAGLELPYQADHWRLFEEKLDASEMADNPEGSAVADALGMDEAVFSKLHRYEAPYQPHHWLRMEALLEEVFTLPRTVLRYKLAELTLMLLLLMALWQLLPPGERPSSTGIQIVERQAIPALDDSAGADVADQQALQAVDNPRSLHNPATSGEGLLNIDPATEMGVNAARPLAAGTSSTSIKPTAFAPSGNARARQLVPPATRLDFSPLNLPGLETALALPRRSLSDDLPALANGSSLAAAARLPERELDQLASIATPAKAAFAALPLKRQRPVFRFGMFGSTDYNHITVPANYERRLFQSFDRHALGYGGGLLLGIELSRRWELELGAAYAARQYPVGIIYIEGSLGTGLQGNELQATELNIINLPLHLRYNFFYRSNWRAYALAGAAMQVVFQSNYYAAQVPAFEYRPIIMPIEPAPGDENIIAQLRREGVAWFEGGSFQENAYLSANLGLGVERYVGTRWSVFAQPTLQYSLHYYNDGLGPNKDLINSLSLWFGARVRLH